MQFGIKRVVAGESENLSGSRKFLEANGVEVIDLNIEECKKIMKEFILTKPEIWKEDIGKLSATGYTGFEAKLWFLPALAQVI